ncbi:Protein of unknown function [Paenibacillus sp. yr247]|uniref:DUF2653 family protein n=1 Tax=Paenibacillus sp. yr247 TaxID=1761880 RepID=UPI0008822463|nr:DUF2653 family protein [Paenibacillus sp. yr247]SDO90684.1 Protein of unknown function [Paenibacillus sp. yr247]
MKIIFNEQDLIDSACIFAADRYNQMIHQLQAEIQHENGNGITAVVALQNSREVYHLTEQDLIDGSAIYLEKYHNFNPNQLSVELIFEPDQGFSVIIEKND